MIDTTRNKPFIATVPLAVIVSTCFFIACFLFSCKDYHRNKSNAGIAVSSIRRGEKLAGKYCQSCHLLPSPFMLDAKTWEQGALPAMGPNLGIFESYFQHYPYAKNDSFISKNFYPDHRMLSIEEWDDLMNFYVATSPDTLPLQTRAEQVKTGLQLFQVQTPQLNYPAPAVCYVKIDGSVQPHQLMACDVNQHLYRFNGQLQITDSLQTTATIVDMDFASGALVACNIGLMNPTNGKFGKAQSLKISANGKLQEDTAALFSSLGRPVQITSADLNADGKKDYVVCEFGYLIGALSWMENKGNDKFERHVLKAVPGAVKAIVQDYNKDGLPDVWALFGQGDEGIVLFTNKGKGEFEAKQMLRFPPMYGSTYFELIDFNKDGHNDIIYTCGDNSDYSQILKPYHGIYIYLNDGKNNFHQQYFFPMNGCYKAIPRDYDGDGDLDIAAISFFADYAQQPDEGFMYLENKGNLNFQPYSIPETKAGRWLTMDAGDLDGDGKDDIVLGNFSVAPTMIKSTVNWEKGPPLMLLKNIGKK